MSFLLGIDIGGTKCAVVLGKRTAEDELHIIDKIAFSTELDGGFDANFEKLCASANAIFERNGIVKSDISRIGISCGGPLDSKKGVILSPPNLPGWDNVPITKMFKERFGIDAVLQNDANAGALAEWKFGAGKGSSDFIFLTFGTGMGAGLILNGKLYSGANDMAGEIGHIRMEDDGPVGYGKEGSFEGFCSGGGIARLAKTMDLEHLGEITAKTVAEAAEAGDKAAQEVYKICGRYLGRGLAVLVDLLNPEMIAVGSIYKRSETLLKNSIMEELEKEALSRSLNVCKIVPAALGEEIGDYSALATAFY